MSVKGAMYAVADNSGAKKVKLIGLLGGSKHRTPQVADVITVAVQEAIPRSRVKEGEVHRAVVVATVQTVRRADGTCVRFPDNRVVILNPQREPIGTRVLGCVARELRKNFLKIISLAEEVV